MEIDKERGNANKLLGRVLYDLQQELPYSLSSISGGLKSNAIPRESEAILSVEPSEVGKLENKIREWNEIVKNELQAADPSVYVKINKSSSVKKCFTKETTERIVQAIMLTPNGVQSMSMNIEGLVESSTNLGVITTTESEIVFQNEIRSSVKSLKEKIVSQVHILAQVVGGRVETKGNYPEWAYNGDSKIRELCKKVYKEKYGEEAEIIAIHAGIECGIFLEKISGLDAISLGPDMYDVHTPDEHLSIPSTIKTWEYLLAVLKEANKI
jgi:dipeptidase D